MNALQKKDFKLVLDTISNVGLSVKDFTFDNKEKFFCMTYANSRLKFNIYPHPSELNLFTCNYVLYKRDFPTVTDNSKYKYTVDILAGITNWLNTQVIEYIIEENRPDPLEEYFKNSHKLLEDINDENAGKFSRADLDKISIANKKLLKLLEENYNVPTEQKEKVSNKLKDLEEKAQTLDKNVWQAFALKTLHDIGVSIASNLIIAGGNALIKNQSALQTFWRFVHLAFDLL